MAGLDRKSIDYNDTIIVTLYVGPEKKEFHVHKVFLCKASTFFRAALEGNFKEAFQHTVDLPTENVTTFQKLVRWLYSDYIVLPSLLAGNNAEYATHHATDLNVLVDLYGLADRLGMEELGEKAGVELCTLVNKASIAQTFNICDLVFNLPFATRPFQTTITATLAWTPKILDSKSTDETRQFLSRCPGLAEQLVIAIRYKYGTCSETRYQQSLGDFLEFEKIHGIKK